MSNRDYNLSSPSRREWDKARTIQRKQQRAEKFAAQGRI